ncbi:MAG TPA: malonyl-CoA decarboxylase family protein [Acidimicrobiales bacterium]|nr:malonyl-CoA decarboxylase family protein [Acidimicrobiales bacterium]
MNSSINSELAALEQTCKALIRLRDETAARSLAELVVSRYTTLTQVNADDAKRKFFTSLVEDFSPDVLALKDAVTAYQEALDPISAQMVWDAAEAPRLDLFRSINLATDGIHTLLHMRADLLRFKDNALSPVEKDLEYLLSSWFNRGFLELQSIDWQTPAKTLEKLIEYEAVHEIRGWDDLRRRLEHDRRCYGFFHPSLPDEPLIFVEVALQHDLATKIGDVIDAPIPINETTDPFLPDTAIFYSITNCQAGLRGIPLGDFLLKQVISELQLTVPSLTQFSTLSPVPGLRRWVDEENIDLETFENDLEKLTAIYLVTAKRNNQPRDPVARFHLRNGAQLEQINIDGDLSPKGQAESFGVLVNYIYDPETVAENHEAFINEHHLTVSQKISKLIKK